MKKRKGGERGIHNPKIGKNIEAQLIQPFPSVDGKNCGSDMRDCPSGGAATDPVLEAGVVNCVGLLFPVQRSGSLCSVTAPTH